MGHLFADHEHARNQQLAHSAIANAFEIALCINEDSAHADHDVVMERAIEASKQLARLEVKGIAKWGVADWLPDWSEVCQSIATAISEQHCEVTEDIILKLYNESK